MDKINLVLIITIVSLFISGCVGENGDSTPVSTPAVTETQASTPAVTAVTVATTPEPTPVRNQSTYKVFIDDIRGFYKVRAVDSVRPFNYTNYTLVINTGDRIIWVSDSDESYTMTVVSEEGLWDNQSAKLMWRYREFSYTFTHSGEYGVYIKEYPKILHQKIIVNP